MLEARKLEIYKERISTELTGPKGGPIQTEIKEIKLIPLTISRTSAISKTGMRA